MVHAPAAAAKGAAASREDGPDLRRRRRARVSGRRGALGAASHFTADTQHPAVAAARAAEIGDAAAAEAVYASLRRTMRPWCAAEHRRGLCFAGACTARRTRPSGAAGEHTRCVREQVRGGACEAWAQTCGNVNSEFGMALRCCHSEAQDVQALCKNGSVEVKIVWQVLHTGF